MERRLYSATTAALVALSLFCALPAAGQDEPLVATREWAADVALSEGLYPGGMENAPAEVWTPYVEGVTALQDWDLDVAAARLDEALKAATLDSERVAINHALAKVYFRRADLKRSWEYAEKARRQAEAEGDRTALAYILKDASIIKRLMGDAEEAFKLAARGSEVAEEIDEPPWRAFYQLSAAEAALEMGDITLGAELLDDAAAIFDASENDYGSAQVTFFRACIMYEEGDYEGAVARCRGVIGEYREYGDRHSEGRALNLIGGCLSAGGDYDRSLDAYMAALDIFRSLDDRICIAKTLYFCAEVFRVWGQYDSAVTALDETLAISREYGIMPIVVEALKTRAMCVGSQGDVNGAKRDFGEARRVAAACGDESSVRRIDFALASFKLVGGKPDTKGAIKGLLDLEERCKAEGDVDLLTGIYEMLVKAYSIEEDYANVLLYQINLCEIYMGRGDKKATVGILGDLSLTLLMFRQYEMSIETSRQAIPLCEELGDDDNLGYHYRGIGICYTKLRRFEKAREALEKAAELHHGTGNRVQLGKDYIYLSALASLTGRPKKAAEFKTAAVDLLGSDEMVDLVIDHMLSDSEAGENNPAGPQAVPPSP